MDYSMVACLDSRMSDSLYEWLYFEAPLSMEVFYNLIINDEVYLDNDRFFERDVCRKHDAEYKEIKKYKKIKFANTNEIFFRDKINYYLNKERSENKQISTTEDDFDYKHKHQVDLLRFCYERNIPFKVSSVYLENYDKNKELSKYVETAKEYLKNKKQCNVPIGEERQILIAKWIIKAKISSLYAASDNRKKEVIDNYINRLLKSNNIKNITDKEYKNAYNVLEKDYDNSIFVTPSEVCEIIKKTKATKEFYKFINKPKLDCVSESGIYEMITEEYEKSRQFDVYKGIAFQVADLTISAGAQIPLAGNLLSKIDEYITSKRNWIISFDQINKKIRAINKNRC